MISKHVNGLVSELLAAAWFTSRGYIVSLPINQFVEYDLIVDNGTDEPKRIQVKTVYFDNSKNRYICNFGLVHKRSDGTTKIKKYDENAFDYCAAVCLEQNAIYILPIKDVAGRRSMTLFPDKEGVTSTNRFRHFEEYKHVLFNNE